MPHAQLSANAGRVIRNTLPRGTNINVLYSGEMLLVMDASVLSRRRMRKETTVLILARLSFARRRWALMLSRTSLAVVSDPQLVMFGLWLMLLMARWVWAVLKSVIAVC